MIVTDKSFDEIMQEHTKALDEGKKIMLEQLITEIKMYKYETFSDLHGAIQNHLDRLESDNE